MPEKFSGISRNQPQVTFTLLVRLPRTKGYLVTSQLQRYGSTRMYISFLGSEFSLCGAILEDPEAVSWDGRK